MQDHVSYLAEKIEKLAYEDNYDDWISFFDGAAGFGVRTDQSVLVYLTFGPTITLDTKAGEVYCYFYDKYGKAKLSERAVNAVNNFFKDIAC